MKCAFKIDFLYRTKIKWTKIFGGQNFWHLSNFSALLSSGFVSFKFFQIALLGLTCVVDGFLVQRKYVDQKSSADKIFGGQKFLLDKNFGTFPYFRDFSLPNFCPIQYSLLNGTQKPPEPLRRLIKHNIHSRNIRNKFKAYEKKIVAIYIFYSSFQRAPFFSYKHFFQIHICRSFQLTSAPVVPLRISLFVIMSICKY